MALADFTDTQIAALGAAVAGIIIAIGNGFRSASKPAAVPVEAPHAPHATSYLVLDAKAVQNLVDALGLTVTQLSLVTSTLRENTEVNKAVREMVHDAGGHINDLRRALQDHPILERDEAQDTREDRERDDRRRRNDRDRDRDRSG